MTLPEHAKTTGDVIAAGLTISTVLAWLPHIAALLTILWTAIRIYETETVQRVVGREYHRQGDIPPALEKVNSDDRAS